MKKTPKTFTKKKETQEKKIEKTAEFPSFNRIITESKRIFKKHFTLLNVIAAYLFLLFFLGLLIVGLDLYQNLQRREAAKVEKQKVLSELAFWQKIANQYKGYRDAYFQIALLEYRLGNYARAKANLAKALDIDPNFEEGRKLEQLLMR